MRRNSSKCCFVFSVYTGFALAEYGIVSSNIAFHAVTQLLDYKQMLFVVELPDNKYRKISALPL